MFGRNRHLADIYATLMHPFLLLLTGLAWACVLGMMMVLLYLQEHNGLPLFVINMRGELLNYTRLWIGYLIDSLIM